jgi:hypothetical protein
MINGFIIHSDMLPILDNIVLQNDLIDENEVKEYETPLKKSKNQKKMDNSLDTAQTSLDAFE